MAMFPEIKFTLISPQELRFPGYILDQMRERGQQYTESEILADCIPELDILYMTRVQRERFKDAAEYRRLKDVYILTRKLLKDAKSDMLIMHPLPRYGEITTDVDDDPRAAYFEQARYGMLIRMALLLEFMHLPRQHPAPVESAKTLGECQNPACVTQSDSYLPKLISDIGTDRCGFCDKKLSVFTL
jgi:aspartate carbamoyltransferase catalytic subunit